MVFSKVVLQTQVQTQVQGKNLGRSTLGRQLSKKNQAKNQHKMQQMYMQRVQMIRAGYKHEPSIMPTRREQRQEKRQQRKQDDSCEDQDCIWKRINKCQENKGWEQGAHQGCELKHICNHDQHHRVMHKEMCQWQGEGGCWYDFHCEQLPIQMKVEKCAQEKNWEHGQWYECENEHKCHNEDFMGKVKGMCERGSQDVCWHVDNCRDMPFNIQVDKCVNGEWQKYDECEYKHKCQSEEFMQHQQPWTHTRCEDLHQQFTPREEGAKCTDWACVEDVVRKCQDEKNQGGNWDHTQWQECELEHKCNNPEHFELVKAGPNCEWDLKEGRNCWLETHCLQLPQELKVQRCVDGQYHIPNIWEQCTLDNKCQDQPLMDELRQLCHNDQNQCWPVEHCENIPVQMQVNECVDGDWQRYEQCEWEHKCRNGEHMKRAHDRCEKNEHNCWEIDHCQRLDDKFHVAPVEMPQIDMYDSNPYPEEHNHPEEHHNEFEIPPQCREAVEQTPECMENEIVSECIHGSMDACMEIEQGEHKPRGCESEEIQIQCDPEHHHEEFHHDSHHHDEFHHDEHHQEERHHDEHHHDEFHNEYESFHSDEFHYEEPMDMNYNDEFHHEANYESVHYEEPMVMHYSDELRHEEPADMHYNDEFHHEEPMMHYSDDLHHEEPADMHYNDEFYHEEPMDMHFSEEPMYYP